MDYPYVHGLPTLDDLYWVVAGLRDARTVTLCGCVLLVRRSHTFLITLKTCLECYHSLHQGLGAPIDIRPRARVLLVPTILLEQSTLLLGELSR